MRRGAAPRAARRIGTARFRIDLTRLFPRQRLGTRLVRRGLIGGALQATPWSNDGPTSNAAAPDDAPQRALHRLRLFCWLNGKRAGRDSKRTRRETTPP